MHKKPGRNVYYDMKSGIKVTGVVATGKNFADAQNSCPAGYHVPSAGIKDWYHSLYDTNNQMGEFATLNADNIRSVIPDMQNHWFWSSSPYGSVDAYDFNGDSGDIFSGYRAYSYDAVLCVAGR